MRRGSRRFGPTVLLGATALALGTGGVLAQAEGSAAVSSLVRVTATVTGPGGVTPSFCFARFDGTADGVAGDTAWAVAYGYAFDGALAADVMPGTYQVDIECHVGLPKTLVTSAAVTVGSTAVDMGSLALAPLPVVSGTVTGPGGVPVVGLSVVFQGPNSSRSAHTDGAGAFEVDLPAGHYVVEFTPGATSTVAGLRQSVDVGAGGLTGLDVSLPAAATATGRVTAAGVGLEFAHVAISPADEVTPPVEADTVTDADGTYTIGGLGTGSYVVTAVASDRALSYADITATAGGSVTVADLELPPATGVISGRVTGADGGTLAETVPVWAESDTESGNGYAEPDSGGAFEITQLGLGRDVIIGVNRESGYSRYTGRYFRGNGLLGSATAAGATPVTASPTAGIGTVRLDTCASVSGRVTDLAERLAAFPLSARVDVIIFNDENPDLVTRAAEVAADGSFEVPGLLPGTYYAALRLRAAEITAAGSAYAGYEVFFGGVEPGVDEPNLTISGCEPVAGVNFGVEPPTAGPADVVSITPVRLADDRAVPAFGQSRCAFVAGAGAPVGATGVLVNVASVSPATQGNVVLYPDDGTASPQPPGAGASVNFEPGRDVANAAFVKVGANGRICWYSQAFSASRVVVDVVGFTMPDSGFVLQESTRLLDTRPGATHVGELAGALARRQVYEVTVAGRAGVPADARAVVLNVAVVDPAGPGHLRVYPADGSTTPPDVATVNYAPGRAKSNAAVVPIGAGGKIALYSDTFSAAPVDVVLDVTGYVTATGTTYHTVTPERVLDTRPSAPTALRPFGTLAANVVNSFDMRGTSVIPDDATGVVLNVTAIHPDTVGNLRVYPDVDGDGQTPPPGASSINYIVGRDIPNLVVVGIPANGRVDFYSNQLTGGRVDLAVDVVGYTTSTGG